MKKYLIAITAIGLLLYSCSNSQSQPAGSHLNATEFSEKISQITDAVVIDVRTPKEFSRGHLAHALNYDWNGHAFQQQITHLDKAKPVFVYCRSGGRSSAAAESMRQQGFQRVYELNGGIIKWRKAGLPEARDNNTSPR